MKILAQAEHDPVYLVEFDGDDGLCQVYNRRSRILHQPVAPISIARFGRWVEPDLGDDETREILAGAAELRSVDAVD